MQALVAQLVKDEHATNFSHVSLPANDNYLDLLSHACDSDFLCPGLSAGSPLRTRRPHSRPGTEKGMAVARNEFCLESRDLVFNWSAQLGFSKGAASCTNLTRAPPLVVCVRGWCLFKSRDFRCCAVRDSKEAADRCAQSGDSTRTEQGRSHVAARGSEFYRFTGSKSLPCTKCDS